MATKKKIPGGPVALKSTAPSSSPPPKRREPERGSEMPAAAETDPASPDAARAHANSNELEPGKAEAPSLADQLRARQLAAGRRLEGKIHPPTASGRRAAYRGVAAQIVRSWREDASAAAALHPSIRFVAVAEVLGDSDEVRVALALVVDDMRKAGLFPEVRELVGGAPAYLDGRLTAVASEELAHFGQILGRRPASLPRLGEDTTAPMRWLVASW